MNTIALKRLSCKFLSINRIKFSLVNNFSYISIDRFDIDREKNSTFGLNSFLNKIYEKIKNGYKEFIPIQNPLNESILNCSTKRKRRAKMNKHKLKKRMKKLRMNTKESRK